MNILYDHQIFAMQKYGGVSRYYFEIADRLARMGNNVEVFAPLYVNEYIHTLNNVFRAGVKIPVLPKVLRLIVKPINPLTSYLVNKWRKNVDIFHETYFSLIDCRPRTAKRVLTVYDMIHEKFPENFSRRDETRHFKAHAVNRADHVICISENTRRDLVESLNIPEKKTSVVYLGHTLGTCKSSLKHGGTVKPFILYVGFRDRYKNFDRLLSVYAHSHLLKNELNLVCFGGGGFTPQELSLARSLNIPSDNMIQISGNDELLASFYASARVFVFPSLYEGFGIPPLEAMSFGCPVVCSNTSSLPEVVGHAAELFDPTSEEQMSSAIERVASDPDKARLLIESGYERIQQFSWDKCARDTFNVYQNILG